MAFSATEAMVYLQDKSLYSWTKTLHIGYSRVLIILPSVIQHSLLSDTFRGRKIFILLYSTFGGAVVFRDAKLYMSLFHMR